MQMVMNSYNVLRQPTQVEYQDLREHFGVWVQTTQLTDLNGFTFQAFYQMEQQTSGEWRIGGCMIQQVERDKI
jgi:6-phosphogluconate dehydrogenase